ncbi:hypothetical protein HII30_05995 [Paenibacillus lemnae]|uniref:Uncharacterized protein n=1 Tax=Paenibacillus lemnae TaxID=1330551 RepID=A0A848M2V8_PAELE|nr:hypothetical protein [Paenibacillus lemnae]
MKKPLQNLQSTQLSRNDFKLSKVMNFFHFVHTTSTPFVRMSGTLYLGGDSSEPAAT